MYLQSKDLNLDELKLALKKISATDFNYIMKGTLEDFSFDYFKVEALNFSNLDTLNLFSNIAELKVRKLKENLYRCVYLGEKLLDIGLDDFSSELKYTNTKNVSTILWGENKPDQDFFVEQNIPHYFRYPVNIKEIKDNQRVILEQVLYFNSFGHIEFIRNYDVKVKTEGELCQ